MRRPRTTRGLHVSDEDFWRLCQANPDLRLERTAKGQRRSPCHPQPPDSGRRNAGIDRSTLELEPEIRGLGVVFDSSTGFTLPNTAIRGPDASWMSRERWDALPEDEREKFSHVCPDFVVELRSTSDDRTKLREKMEEYIDQGARLGWLIDPKTARSRSTAPASPSRPSRSPQRSPARMSCQALCST